MKKIANPKNFIEFVEFLEDNNIITYNNTLPDNILDLPSGRITFTKKSTDLENLNKKLKSFLGEFILLAHNNRDINGLILDSRSDDDTPIPSVAGLYNRIDNFTIKPSVKYSDYINVDINDILPKGSLTSPYLMIPKDTKITVYNIENTDTVKSLYYTIEHTSTFYTSWENLV